MELLHPQAIVPEVRLSSGLTVWLVVHTTPQLVSAGERITVVLTASSGCADCRVHLVAHVVVDVPVAGVVGVHEELHRVAALSRYGLGRSPHSVLYLGRSA